MDYGYRKTIEASFEEAYQQVQQALTDEGFGVLTEIDVTRTLQKKLGVKMPHYVILGACNPPFAHQALLTEHEIGLLLPCNVIIYEQGTATTIATILPTTAMSMVNNPALQKIAQAIEKKLRRAIDQTAIRTK